MSFAILRTAKLKTFGNIAGSLHHTFRSIDTPNANPELTHLNVNTFQNTEIALEKIKERIPEKRRKDAVLCVEYLITGSPEWDGWTNNKKDEYFRNSIEWLEQKHGKENVVMTSIQLDESTPHMVAYVVPIDEKGKLNAKKFLGGREKLREMQTEFAQKIGEPLGLKRGIEGSKADHQTIKNYYSKVSNTEILPSVNIEIPKKGIMENHESYESRIFEMLEKEVSPILQSTYALQNELFETRKQLEKTKKDLAFVLEHTAVYRLAMQPLTPMHREKLNNEIKQKSFEFRQSLLPKPKPKEVSLFNINEQIEKAAELSKLMDFELAPVGTDVDWQSYYAKPTPDTQERKLEHSMSNQTPKPPKPKF